jgi:tRNA A37 threonylcarbamoyltransferase TsaD
METTEVAVKVVRADSIKIADLVTHEQIVRAATRFGVLPILGSRTPAAMIRKVIEELDKARGITDEN